MTNHTNGIEINFDNILNIANRGIRRATVFAGFGINAARDDQFIDFDLSKLASFKFMPTDVTAEVMSDYKIEFERWIIVSALRELIESFSVFLDSIHHACLIMATNKGKYSESKALEYKSAFEFKGLEKKLKKLKNRFDIFTSREDYLISINKVRNCLSHRRGVVGTIDVNKKQSLVLKWWGLSLYVLSTSGVRTELTTPMPSGGILIKDGGGVYLGFKDKNKSYPIGHAIAIEPKDLIEICYIVKLATDDISKLTINYAKSIGVLVNRKVVNENIK